MAVGDRLRANLFWVVFFGGLLFLAGLWITYQIFGGMYGLLTPVRLFTPAALVESEEYTGVRVALLRSGYTASYLPDGVEWVNRTVSSWEVFFLNRGVRYRVISDADLEEGLERTKFNVLVLPGAICMSEAEISAVKSFLARGNGVVMTWAVGSRREDGTWRGWDFLSSVAGIEITGEITSPEAKYLTLKGGSPITAGVPIGFRMGVTTFDRPLKAAVLEDRTRQDGYWYNFVEDEGLAWEESRNSSGLVHGNYLSGRFVWLSFPRTAVVGTIEHQRAIERITSNAIRWVGHLPIAWPHPWPNDYRAAAAFEMDTEHKFENALNVIPLFQSRNLPTTFFILTSLAEKYPDVVRSIARVGEIAIHADVHTVFKWQPYETQLNRLKKASDFIYRVTGKRPKGFRPPETLFDANTIRAMREVGLEYIWADTLFDQSQPYFPVLDGKRIEDIVVLPGTAKDDYFVMIHDSIRDNDLIYGAFREDLDRVHELGGLYVFSYHTHILAEPEHVEVLGRLLDYAKAKNMWIASCGEIADWWKKIYRVRVAAFKRRQDRFVLTISNIGEEPIRDATIVVALPIPAADVLIRPELLGTPVPEHVISDDGETLFLHMGLLKGGETRNYMVEIRERG